MATITSSATASGLQLTNSGGTASSWIIQSDGGAVAGQGALRFYSLTTSAYRMAITSGGQLLVGTDSTDSGISVDFQNLSSASSNVLVRAKNTTLNEDCGFVISANSSGTQRDYTIGIQTIVNSSDLTFSGPTGFQWYVAGSPRFTIASTGAATFSSSVTATQFIANGNSAGGFEGLRIINASTGAAQIVLNNSAQSWFVNTRTDNHFSIYNNTSSTTPFLITTGGNVLIGTTTDSGAKLHVQGDITLSGEINCTGRLILDAGAGNGFLFRTNNVTTTAIDIASSGTCTFSSLGTGTVVATAGTISTVSDSTYKLDDGFIDSAIEKVLNLKPRYFYWNEKSGLPKDIRQLGFYAQEVNEALGEEAANTPQDKNTPWGISDRSMIAMLTKAIQELKQEIDTLKN
jgi:hypothetical protein